MIIFHLYYDLLVGGIQTMLVNLANCQVALGHEVSLLIINDAIDVPLAKSLDSRVKIVCFGKKTKQKNPIPIIALNLYLCRYKYDVIHFHNPRLFKMIFVQIEKKRICCTQHCLCKGKWDSDYLCFFNNRCSISKAVKDDIYEKYKLDSVIVYNGIITSSIRTNGEKLNKDGDYHIVQVGRIYTTEKGQDITLKAIASIKEKTKRRVVVDFIGDGSAIEIEALKRLSVELGISSDVRFLGLQNQQYIAQHLCEYDLLVQPSREEGFGLSIAEAMAAKVLVLVSDVSGPLDVINYGECGISFKRGRVDDCANKMLGIINGTIKEMDMIEKAYYRVKSTFDISITAKTYQDLYISMINGNTD